MDDNQTYNIDDLKKQVIANLNQDKSKYTPERLKKIRELAKAKFANVKKAHEERIVQEKPIKQETQEIKLNTTTSWISLPQEEVKKLSPDIDSVLIRSVDGKTHIIWSKNDDTYWEAYIECEHSLKKTIMIALHNPAYRGTITRTQYNKITQQGLKICRLFTTSKGDSQATRQVIAQLSKVPESPNSQSNINNLHLP